MADTTIDSLVVTLGLDARSFKIGALAAKRAMDETRKGIEDAKSPITSSVAAMGTSVGKLALQFTGLFFAIRGIADIVSGFKKLSDTLWHLGIDSQNIGVTANRLRNLQEVSKLAGGSIEDATQSAMGLQQSLFNLRFKGEISDQLIMLARLGVQFQTTGGKARDLYAVAFDTSQKLKAQGFDEATRYQYALSTGQVGGIANAIAKGPDTLADFMEIAKKDNKDITDKVVDSQAQLQQAVVSLDFKTADASSVLLNKVTPALEGLTSALGIIGPAIEVIADALGLFSPSKIGEKLDNWLDPLAPSRGVRNNNPLNLKATGSQAHDAQGFAVFPNYAAGLSAARNQLQIYSSRGINTIRGIISTWAPAKDHNNVAAYVASVSKALGKDPDLPLSPGDYPALMSAMQRVESGAGVPGAGGRALPPNPSALGAAAAAVPTPRAALPAARPSAAAGAPIASNSVQVDSITIHTQATDADGIFADARRAVQRKFSLSQAERGLV